jgi:hypothetical protein
VTALADSTASLRVLPLTLTNQALPQPVIEWRALGDSAAASRGQHVGPLDTTLVPRTYKVIARHVGFRQRDTTIVVPSRTRLTVTVPMEELPCPLLPVVPLAPA